MLTEEQIRKARPGDVLRSMPGVWDSDNGEIAGHKCAECALFEMASKLSV